MSASADTPLRMGTAEWSLLLVLSLLWGGSFFFFKVLAPEIPPLTLVLGRVGLAAAALLIVMAVRRESLALPRATWGPFVLLGLFNNVIPFTLLAFATATLSSGLAAILNATTPLFAVLFAHLLTRDEKLTWNKGLGIVLGLAGVAVVIGPSVLLGFGSGGLWGELACLGASLVYGFSGIYARRFRHMTPLRATTGQLLGSTLVLIPLAAIFDQPWTLPVPSLTAWAALFGIALLSTALAFILYFRILAVAGATNVSLVTFLVPVSALLLGWSILGEAITWSALAGMAVIAVGLACSDGRPLRHIRAQLA